MASLRQPCWGSAPLVPAGGRPPSSPPSSPHLRSPLHILGGTGTIPKAQRGPAESLRLCGLWAPPLGSGGGRLVRGKFPPPGTPGALPGVLHQAPSHVLRSTGRSGLNQPATGKGPSSRSGLTCFDSIGTHTGIGLVPPESTNVPGSQVYDTLNASDWEKQTTRTITFARFSGFDRCEFAS